MSAQPPRRAVRAPLLACAGLAMALHGMLLGTASPAWFAPAVPLGGNPAPGRPALQVSLRHEQAGPPKAPPAAAAVPAWQPEPAPLEPPPESPGMAPQAPGTAVPDRLAGLPDGELLIPFPDLPRPEGALRLRLLLQLDAGGMPVDIQSDAAPALAAFAEASIHALGRQRYQPAYRDGQAQAASLCLEVSFDDAAAAAELILLTNKGREDCLRAPSDP